MEKEYVRLISGDGFVFILEKEIACLSGTIRAILNEGLIMIFSKVILMYRNIF